ncbi:MAG: single-stranded-DNA-specific exonuclease RecJ [Deltaproteobacteria bacterium]|nr:single-stranded-DNA-specific exonuclease RecJ [Deltaproteobacteria bacterium]
MKKQITVLQPDRHEIEILCKALNCSPILAGILINREITSPEKAERFLNPSIAEMRPPFSIKDMDDAVRRISTAIARNEKILIFGDYDVDGITATTILLEFLRDAGADVSYYIPHRTKEGYSLKVRHISDVALPGGVNLIITADCGAGSHDAVSAANAAGIDVVITDHHMTTGDLPEAVAVVNPCRPDCASGFNNLSGVGVAFYLLICLRKHLRDTNFWRKRPEPNLKRSCDAVALGTVADMVPLVDENRTLLHTGLEVINSGKRPGLKALMEISGKKGLLIETHDIAFGLAPRLNAAGRVGHASTAVELLTATDTEAARRLSDSLDRMNSERRIIENALFEEVRLYLDNNPHLLDKKSLVLWNYGWHESVLGIVASRILRIYFRPVVLISVRDGDGKGSARSIPGFDLYQGLTACKGCLEDFGGHAMAAGLQIKMENLDLFRNDFEKAVDKMTRPDNFVPKILIDQALDFIDISPGLLDELESLKPFGTGNPEPLFMARNVRAVSWRIVGKNHRQMVLEQPSGGTGVTFNAIHFNIDRQKPFDEDFDEIVFRLRWNQWNQKKTIQFVVETV